MYEGNGAARSKTSGGVKNTSINTIVAAQSILKKATQYLLRTPEKKSRRTPSTAYKLSSCGRKGEVGIGKWGYVEGAEGREEKGDGGRAVGIDRAEKNTDNCDRRKPSKRLNDATITQTTDQEKVEKALKRRFVQQKRTSTMQGKRLTIKTPSIARKNFGGCRRSIAALTCRIIKSAIRCCRIIARNFVLWFVILGRKRPSKCFWRSISSYVSCRYMQDTIVWF
jgi:hypothetical protein